MKHLIVIVGPTAVGKTALCIELAKHFRTEIVNADSRQVYQEMSIGTAKPTPEELAAAPHHLVDFLPISQPYNAGQYETDALACLQIVFQGKETAILSGGSGLYVKAVTDGMDDVPSSENIRAELMQQYESEGLENLLSELATADPAYFAEVDKSNPHRVMRALEVIRVSGKPFSAFRQQQPKKRPFNIIKIGLNRDREELYQRINHRMDLMLKSGLIEEAKKLYPQKHLNALQTVGYQELFDHWDGKYAYEEAVRLLKRNSRRYAKRQMTWFNRDGSTKWFHPDQLPNIIGYVEGVILRD